MSYDISQDQDLWNSVQTHYKTDVQRPWAWNPVQANFDSYKQTVNNQVTNYQNQFQNFVGRSATDQEIKDFVNNYIIPNTNDLSQTSATSPKVGDPNTYIQQYISTNNQQAAKDYATQQLTQQQGQWQSLADSFRQQGSQAINSTEQMLNQYSQQLFQQLQPQLLTSLQAQGMLNSGALNEAEAGAQKDLAAANTGFLANANLNMQNQANQIALGGQAAPLQYQQGLAQNSLPYLQGQGQMAGQNAYGTFMNGLQYNEQLGLLNQQAKLAGQMQPSMLGTLGRSFANSFGNSSGQYAAQLPFGMMQSYGGGSGMGSLGSSMMG